MKYWYSEYRKEIEDLSVLIGQMKTDLINAEMPDDQIPMSRWGTVRRWGSGYILDYSEEYDEVTTLSILDININDLISVLKNG